MREDVTMKTSTIKTTVVGLILFAVVAFAWSPPSTTTAKYIPKAQPQTQHTLNMKVVALGEVCVREATAASTINLPSCTAYGVAYNKIDNALYDLELAQGKITTHEHFRRGIHIDQIARQMHYIGLIAQAK